MHERIVYGQQDLLDAINDGIRSITLCAGIYKIPIAPGVIFDRLGPVAVSVDGTRAEADAQGMVFREIYPEYKSGYAIDSQEPLYTVGAVSSGSYGSYAGSFAGSYRGSYAGSFGSFAGFGGSFAGSLSWYTGMGGSFRYGSFGFGSFAYGSFSGSFASINAGSFGGSFTGSGGSLAGSGMSGSLAASPGGGMPDMILGYGIDLI